MATRVLAGDIFGLEKHVPWGTQIHSFLVGDYQEKSLCISQISEFREAMSVRRKCRESIEQCLDEMLMNALYDALVDEQGRPIFSEIPTRTRISLRVEQKVVVQYVCDGKQFALAVRDAFGTLERSIVLRYLDKCLHSEQPIDRKTGGAGLGLYLIASSASGVFFHVLPGVADRGGVHVRPREPEAPARELRVLHREDRRGGPARVGALQAVAGRHLAPGRAPGTSPCRRPRRAPSSGCSRWRSSRRSAWSRSSRGPGSSARPGPRSSSTRSPPAR
jgi:hypothetical protein